MKIGFLVKTVNPKNGIGKYANDIIENIKSVGHEVVILKEDDDPFEGKAILKRGIGLFSCIKAVKENLQSCDIIHAIDGYPYGVIGWLANRKLKKRLIVSALGTYAVAPLYNWKTSFLLKRAYISASTTIAISHLTKNEILKKVKLNNIVVVHPGIKQIKIISTPAINKTDDPRYILGVGAMKERKGYHISLEAFGKIKDQFPFLNYYIVADYDPAWFSVLSDIIKRYDMADRVKFFHNISDKEIQELYNNALLFVLTPINTIEHHFEGFGIVYLEAARSGLPVIGTYGTGAEDAINNGKNGTLVRQNNAHETAEAMRKILGDKDLQGSMGEQSIEWSKLNSVEREVDKILEIYNS